MITSTAKPELMFGQFFMSCKQAVTFLYSFKPESLTRALTN